MSNDYPPITIESGKQLVREIESAGGRFIALDGSGRRDPRSGSAPGPIGYIIQGATFDAGAVSNLSWRLWVLGEAVEASLRAPVRIQFVYLEAGDAEWATFIFDCGPVKDVPLNWGFLGDYHRFRHYIFQRTGRRLEYDKGDEPCTAYCTFWQRYVAMLLREAGKAMPPEALDALPEPMPDDVSLIVKQVSGIV